MHVDGVGVQRFDPGEEEALDYIEIDFAVIVIEPRAALEHVRVVIHRDPGRLEFKLELIPDALTDGRVELVVGPDAVRAQLDALRGAAVDREAVAGGLRQRRAQRARQCACTRRITPGGTRLAAGCSARATLTARARNTRRAVILVAGVARDVLHVHDTPDQPVFIRQHQLS